MSNFEVNGEASNQAGELNPSVVRALATGLFTEGHGALREVWGGHVAQVATLRLIKHAKEAVQELLLRHSISTVIAALAPPRAFWFLHAMFFE